MVEGAQVQPVEGEDRQHDEERDEHEGEITKHLGDRRMAQQRHDQLRQRGNYDHGDLGRAAQRGPVVGEQQDHGGDHEVDALDLEPDLGHPVEERHRAVPVLPERRAADHEGGRAGLRALQAGPSEQRVEEVADADREDRLPHGQAKDHDQSPVKEELHVEHRTGPEPEEARGLHLAFGVRDQVDPALLDLEGRVLLLRLGPVQSTRPYGDVTAHRYPQAIGSQLSLSPLSSRPPATQGKLCGVFLQPAPVQVDRWRPPPDDDRLRGVTTASSSRVARTRCSPVSSPRWCTRSFTRHRASCRDRFRPEPLTGPDGWKLKPQKQSSGQAVYAPAARVPAAWPRYPSPTRQRC